MTALVALPHSIGEALELIGREADVLHIFTKSNIWLDGVRSVHLPNGWRVIVFTHGKCPEAGVEHHDFDQCCLAEPRCHVTIFEPSLVLFKPHGMSAVVANCGWPITSPELLRVVDAVALYRDGGPCPCPDCLRARVGETS